MPTTEEVVAKYVELRDRKAVLKKQYEDDVAALDTALERLEAWCKMKMDADGETSIATKAGTVFKTYKESASVADMDAIWAYAIEHNLPTLFQKRLNVNTVRELMIPTNDGYELPPPPGVNFERIEDVQFRRPTKK